MNHKYKGSLSIQLDFLEKNKHKFKQYPSKNKKRLSSYTFKKS